MILANKDLVFFWQLLSTNVNLNMFLLFLAYLLAFIPGD